MVAWQRRPGAPVPDVSSHLLLGIMATGTGWGKDGGDKVTLALTPYPLPTERLAWRTETNGTPALAAARLKSLIHRDALWPQPFAAQLYRHVLIRCAAPGCTSGGCPLQGANPDRVDIKDFHSSLQPKKFLANSQDSLTSCFFFFFLFFCSIQIKPNCLSQNVSPTFSLLWPEITPTQADQNGKLAQFFEQESCFR